ncbi:MAG: DUF3822 family protein [Saprospiraceae bacterium]|nr:DUF3822 family protein [Saprospiraceae bacterium]MCF8252350.1 DUF3822 family protein [Saprospiraceae bacterium]MCF8282191.1 DUF3822 family protein [Bacteroidales bacterium]MCF8311858.1 DUF3822 family protein [Saprospiraceae bacterium]MCF8442702.1 DUF3822 family protein [Saprospiraceae bacterium]
MNYDILESDFNKKLSTAYQLSILIGMDSLVYFAFDTNNNNALLLRKVPYVQSSGTDGFGLIEELKKIFAREDLLAYLFRRVKITMPDIQPVLVPARLYNEYEKTTYFTELMGQGQVDAIQNDELEELALQILYPTDPTFMAMLKKQFPTAKFYNNTTPYLLGCRKTLDEDRTHNLFAHFTQKNIYITLFEKKNLLFSNSFKYQTAGDALYYILLTYNQHNLDPAQQSLNLSGQILANAEIYKTLFRYIGELKFMPFPNFLNFSRKFSEVPTHFFFDLYSLALCK